LKETDTGQEKVKKICDLLRRETLEPAQKEAQTLLEEAKRQAQEILLSAKNEAEKIQKQAEQDREREMVVFQSSLHQACKQSLAALREDIERRFFQEGLMNLVREPMQDPKVIATLIQAVVQAIEKGGLDVDLDVVVPKNVSLQSIHACLLQNTVDRLKSKDLLVGPIRGGIAVKLLQDNITIDLTDEALIELVSTYMQKQFREVLFQAGLR